MSPTFEFEELKKFVETLQNNICQSLEAIDGHQTFKEDLWKHTGGGGGRTRVLQNGHVIEKGGVNTSAVHGIFPESFRHSQNFPDVHYSAVGISMVLHPLNPYAPAFHANFRAICCGKKAWFGGGADLTPCYIFPEDAKYFHLHLKSLCDPFDASYYPDFKKQCDEYFYLPHRNETRGVGGLFFDHLEPLEKYRPFWEHLSSHFFKAYTEILVKRMSTPYTSREKDWQEIRRGRYVEFNLMYDRGTLFGLQTGGRTESILMSLPPVVQWSYTPPVEAGSPEAELYAYLKSLDWANFNLSSASKNPCAT